MLGVAKRVKLSENSPVNFDLDGHEVIDKGVRREGRKVVVRYRTEKNRI
jgi:hypothetical protein